MAYTENKSIDGLTAITPTTDDLVVTMDQAEVGVAKSSTLLSVYNLFKTTYDTVYAKYLGDADFYKYSIVTSVASGNLTVALKNYEGNDPTPTKPIKIQIGGVIRSITSAMSITKTSGTNWCNAGSSELATKEIDWFSYLIFDSTHSLVKLFAARIPSANRLGYLAYSTTDEKGILEDDGINNNPDDPVVNIGRFNATLSAGGAYTWSIPATSVIINSPIYETRWLDWQPIYTCSGSMTYSANTQVTIKYRINGSSLDIGLLIDGTTGGTASIEIKASLPFTPTSQIKTGAGIYDSGLRCGIATTVGANVSFLKSDTSNWNLGGTKEIAANLVLPI